MARELVIAEKTETCRYCKKPIQQGDKMVKVKVFFSIKYYHVKCHNQLIKELEDAWNEEEQLEWEDDMDDAQYGDY